MRQATHPLTLASALVVAAWLCGGGATAAAPPLDAAHLERPPLTPALAVDPGPPPRADDRGYDVLHYDLDLRIDPHARTVAGEVAVTAAFPGGQPPDTLVLDLVPALAVDGATWNGAAVGVVRADEELDVLPPPGATGDAVVRIVYHGSPQPHGAFRAGMLFRTEGNSAQDPGGETALTMSEPWSAHAWWPCKDHPSDKATARFTLTVPDTLVAVANGVMVGAEPADAGWRRFVWETSYPVATYLMTVQVAGYATWEETCDAAAGPLTLTYHVFPRDEARARFDLAATCGMIRLMEDVAGPYPFAAEGYGQAEFKWGGAMEHQTRTCLGTGVFKGDGSQRTVMLHELAHQWFGDLVTPDAWADVWLNEGFASYAEAIWLERTVGRDAMLARMREIGPVQHPDLFVGDGLLGDPDPILPNLLVYHKGAWVLHMLRAAIGDSTFFRLLRDWAQDPSRAYGNVTTDDFVAAASAAADEDLTPFFTPWLRTDAAPLVAWSTTAVPGSDGGVRVAVTLRQLQEVRFDLAIPLRLATTRARRDTVVRLDEPARTWTFALPGAWKGLAVDPEGWVLMARRPLPEPALKLAPPAPNPAGGDGTLLTFRVRTGGPVTVELYDVRGRRLGRWPLGALPARDAPYPWRWTGTDGDGRPVSAGIYWLSVIGSENRSTQKVTLIR